MHGPKNHGPARPGSLCKGNENECSSLVCKTVAATFDILFILDINTVKRPVTQQSMISRPSTGVERECICCAVNGPHNER